MKKLLFISVICFTMIGCAKITKPIEVKEVRVYWGTKADIQLFLDSPQAKSERWLVEALGE